MSPLATSISLFSCLNLKFLYLQSFGGLQLIILKYDKPYLRFEKSGKAFL